MKITRFFFAALLLLTLQAAYAQQLYKCSATKSFWIIEKDNSFFTVGIPGNVKETDKKNIIAVDSFALQYVIVEKKHFIEEDSSGMTPLIKYALNESEYFSGVYNHKVNVNFQKAEVKSHDVLIWFFELPSHVSQGVKNQVFASMLSGDKIFGLAAPQFPGQELEDVKNLLVDVIITLKRDEVKIDAAKLCSER